MDFGDVIFFLVFIGIIISNIVRQIEKSQQKAENRQAGEPAGKSVSDKKSGPEKKGGWKDLLTQMLEEAQRQMEAPAGGQAKPAPDRAPTGWETITGPAETPPTGPVRKTEQGRMTRFPRPPVISDESAEGMETPAKFKPQCMRCNHAMKEITDFGVGGQNGLIYCDNCGEQHHYRIIDGRLKLKQVAAARESVIPPERKSQPVPGMPEERVTMVPAAATGGKIPLALSKEGLQSAVVWAEILGPPRAFKDLEV